MTWPTQWAAKPGASEFWTSPVRLFYAPFETNLSQPRIKRKFKMSGMKKGSVTLSVACTLQYVVNPVFFTQKNLEEGRRGR
jgi:hypothetical protein